MICSKSLYTPTFENTNTNTFKNKRFNIKSSVCAVSKNNIEATNNPLNCGEDSFYLNVCRKYNTISMGVADGVGGWNEFGISPALFARQLMDNAYNESIIEDNPKKIIENAYTNLLNKPNIFGSSTCCILYIDADNVLHSANIGDSGWIIIRDGIITSRSSIQKVDVYCPKQLANIPPHLNHINAIQTPLTDIDYTTTELLPNDIIIMATDGLWDNIYNDANYDVLAKKVYALYNEKCTPHGIATRLLYNAKSCWKKPDDITIIVSIVTRK